MNSLVYSVIFSVCLNIRIFDIYLDSRADSAACSHVKTQTLRTLLPVSGTTVKPWDLTQFLDDVRCLVDNNLNLMWNPCKYTASMGRYPPGSCTATTAPLGVFSQASPGPCSACNTPGQHFLTKHPLPVADSTMGLLLCSSLLTAELWGNLRVVPLLLLAFRS